MLGYLRYIFAAASTGKQMHQSLPRQKSSQQSQAMVSGVQGEESRTQLEEFLHRVDDPGATAGSLVLLRLPTRGNKEFRILLADKLMRIIEVQKTFLFIFLVGAHWGQYSRTFAGSGSFNYHLATAFLQDLRSSTQIVLIFLSLPG